MMEDNLIRTATDTREVGMSDKVSGEDSGGRALEEMQDNRDGYVGGGDVGRQHMRCGTTEMAKWVGRTRTDWEIIDRERLPT